MGNCRGRKCMVAIQNLDKDRLVSFWLGLRPLTNSWSRDVITSGTRVSDFMSRVHQSGPIEPDHGCFFDIWAARVSENMSDEMQDKTS